MEPTNSEPKQPALYLVATPKRVEVWEAYKRPRVTVSKALTKARVPGYRNGRRVKRTEPIQLVKMDIVGEGKRVLSLSMDEVSTMLPYLVGMPDALRQRFNWVRFGDRMGYHREGDRFLCNKLTRQAAERICEYLLPRGQ